MWEVGASVQSFAEVEHHDQKIAALEAHHLSPWAVVLFENLVPCPFHLVGLEVETGPWVVDLLGQIGPWVVGLLDQTDHGVVGL